MKRRQRKTTPSISPLLVALILAAMTIEIGLLSAKVAKLSGYRHLASSNQPRR